MYKNTNLYSEQGVWPTSDHKRCHVYCMFELLATVSWQRSQNIDQGLYLTICMSTSTNGNIFIVTSLFQTGFRPLKRHIERPYNQFVYIFIFT
jgi:hypothetical protein